MHEGPPQSSDALEAAITANLAALARLLEQAAKDASEAAQHAQKRERNSAIGTVMGMGKVLADAQAFLATAIALHRTAGSAR